MLRALDLLARVPPPCFALPRPLPSIPSVASSSLTPPPVDRSPYFTPPKSAQRRSRKAVDNGRESFHVAEDSSAPKRRTITTNKRGAAPPTPRSPTPKRRKRVAKVKSVKPDFTTETGVDPPVSAGSRPKRKRRKESIPVVEIETTLRSRRQARKGHPTPTLLAKSERGVTEPVGKIHLIQERVRHDPWRLLIATCLLNVTSGRAARPIYIELLRRYPTALALSQASVLDLSELLHPLGLFNQRANTLIRFSNQYLMLGWPIHPHSEADPFLAPTMPISIPATGMRIKAEPQGSDDADEEASDRVPVKLDVNVFHGAGRYASDSFRIYSDLLPGKGAPEREGRWVQKRERAMKRLEADKQRTRSKISVEATASCDVRGEEEEVEELDVVEVGEYLSEEEDVGKEEWRMVRPNDKELKRYLIWRWGLEGIMYDIKSGPIIAREGDKNRLSHLLSN